MGQFKPVAVRAPGPTSARGLLLGALAFSAMAMAALSSPGFADATCATISGVGVGAGCTSTPTSFAVGLDTNSSASAQGLFEGASAVGNPVRVAESMAGTDAFGPYGCEDFVDAVYGRTTATGIGHDAALAFYRSLADRGLAHHEMPVPRGALVFSAGADGDHVDISRGDGTYISAGVQGLSPGYGDGHNVQILPTPNLGSWTLYGWVYPPW
jgi:cell wall-associated NlpC family hydrolase